MRLPILAPAAFLSRWTAVAAQDINPDRPDLTTSAELVPAGALQIETGLEYGRARVGGGPAERQLSEAARRPRADRQRAAGRRRAAADDARATVGPEPRRQCRRGRDRAAAARGLHSPGHRLGVAPWAMTDQLTTITELYVATKDERDGRHGLLATVALMYRVTPRLAVDAGMRTTLAGPGPDWSAFIGLSVRLGR